MLNVAIVGARGLTGRMLVDILARHPKVRITSLSATNEEPERISDKIDLCCVKRTAEEVIKSADFIFTALPHTASMEVVPEFLKAGKKVVDLSADYRIEDISAYEQVYNIKHKSSEYVKEAVYGLPELYRDKIKSARLVANPGCYPTSIILPLAPLLKAGIVAADNIICDSKSGVTGAGRVLSERLQENEENLLAYKVGVHQHIPEIEQELSKLVKEKVEITFVPHLIPMNRGILTTIYLNPSHPLVSAPPFVKGGLGGIMEVYEEFYKDEPFIDILGDQLPQTKDLYGTNNCAIGFKLIGKRLIVLSAIDNLLKGASGQAVQNMNIMCGFGEREGL